MNILICFVMIYFRPERHLLIKLPNDPQRQQAYLRDLPISTQDPNPEQKAKEILSKIDDANVKYLQRKIAKILQKNGANQELSKYSKYYQILPPHQKLSYTKSPIGIRNKIVQEVLYSVPEPQMFLNENERDSIPMFQENYQFVPLQNFNMEVGDLPEPATFFMPPPVAILSNNNQQDFAEIFEMEPAQYSSKTKENVKAPKDRRRGKSMRALFPQGHASKHAHNTDNGVEISEFDGNGSTPLTAGEGKVFSLLPSRHRAPKPIIPQKEDLTSDEEGDGKGIFNRQRPLVLPQGPVKNSPAFYIHRLRVREGGLAIAGPGGIATAGRGGTAIVGPDGVAYATREGTAIAGPGASVVSLSDGSNLNKLAEELSRKDINVTQNENPTSKYLEGEYVSTGEGRNSRKIFIPTGGKLVAKGPVIYHNTEAPETEESTVEA